jgi:CrcB protein
MIAVGVCTTRREAGFLIPADHVHVARLQSGRIERGMTLESYFWIALGSALGGAGRYWCSGLVARHFGETFPWGTLVVNVLGSFVVGFADALLASTPARQLVMSGLCGGYTTFSSFSLQTLNLARDGEWASAGANVGASVGTCLISVWLGHIAAVALNQAKWV